MVKNENQICRPKNLNFENFDFFLQKPNFSTFLVSEMENQNNDLMQNYPRIPNMQKYWTICWPIAYIVSTSIKMEKSYML